MSIEEGESKRRRRTTVERLDLTDRSLSRSLNQSGDDSFMSDDNSLYSESNGSSSRNLSAVANVSAENDSKSSKDHLVLFKSKSFLTVRNETGGFFLCQAVNSIYDDSKKCKIQWLEEMGDNKYKYGLVDWVDPLAIIAKVKVKRCADDANLLQVLDEDIKKVSFLLEKALKDGGITVEFTDDEDSSDKEKPVKSTDELLNDNDFYDAEKSDDDQSPDDDYNKNIKKQKKKKQSLSGDVSAPEKKITKDDKSNDKKKLDHKKEKKNDAEMEVVTKIKSSPKQKKPLEIVKKKNKLDDDTDELDSDREPPPKKELKKPNNTSPKKEAKQINNLQPPPKATITDTSQPAISPNTIKKRRLIKEISNRHLVENSRVSIYAKDPFFEDNNVNIIPYVSPIVQSKLAFRAVLLDDVDSVKKLIENTGQVPSLHVGRSLYNTWTPSHYALFLGNKKMLELLLNDFIEPKTNRVQILETMLEKFSNGVYNPRSLGGTPFIRKLTESRGVKEGNNAFTKDQTLLKYAKAGNSPGRSSTFFFKELFELAFEYGASPEMFDFLLEKWNASSAKSSQSRQNYYFGMQNDCRFIYDNIYKAILFGHRKLAAHVIENAPPGHGFNAVHIEVLKADNDSELKCNLRANMCTKKPFANDFITPIHCACINPSVKYLKTLLSITQDFNVSDKRGRKPVHFAAVCEEPTPLEYLISRVSPYELDSEGSTPLHYACLAGRPKNVEILLQYAERKQEDEAAMTSEVLIHNKYGLGGINKPNRKGRLPLHLAISRNNYECVLLLIKYGCNLEYPLPNSMGKITPLMYACQMGNLKMVKLLVDNNAKISARDRFQRNSSIHASMCGHTHILSYLLRRGSEPNACDSSGNSCLHYACAYGWYYPMKTLIEAGADVNSINDWKLTPFGAAFLKGHVGICDQLLVLHRDRIDINFRTEDGETLVMLAVSSTNIFNESSIDQLDYLINKLSGDVKLVDSKGNNAFHYLASNNIDVQAIERELADLRNDEAEFNKLVKEKLNEQEKFRLQMAKLLLDAKCDPNLENNDFETPLITALKCLNTKFARYLLSSKEIGCQITLKHNMLAILAEKCLDIDPCYAIFGDKYGQNYDIFNKHKSKFEQMASQKDENGFTPFQIACCKLNEYLTRANVEKLAPHLSAFIVFLYKDCKSNPNEPVNLKNKNATDEDADNAEEPNFKFNSRPIMTPRRQIVTDCLKPDVDNKNVVPIFKLVSDRCVDLIEDLYNLSKNSALGLTKIDFNAYDMGLTPLLKAIIDREFNFAHKLLDLAIYDDTNVLKQQICRQTHSNESIIQLLIRSSRIELLDKIVDKMLPDKSNLSELLLHENVYKQNFIHILASRACDASSADLNIQYLKDLFRKLPADKISTLIRSRDLMGRNPIHLCLMNSETPKVNIDLEMFLIDNIFTLIDGLNSSSEFLADKDVFERQPLHYLFCQSNFKKDSSLYKSASKTGASSKSFDRLEHCYISSKEAARPTTIDPVELLTVLLKRVDKSKLDEKDQFGYTPMHYAAIRGSTICCSLLIANGCDYLSRAKVYDENGQSTEKPNEGNTPLSSSIYFKRETCALTLLRSIEQSTKADSFLNDFYFLHPYDYSSRSRDDFNQDVDFDDVKTTLKWKGDTKQVDLHIKSRLPLYELILSHKWEGISWLILANLEKYNLNMFQVIQSAINSHEFAFALRLIQKYQDECKDVLQFYEFLFKKCKRESNRTLLHSLSRIDVEKISDKFSIVRILQILLNSNIPKDAQSKYEELLKDYLLSKDDFGSSALHYACYINNYKFIDFVSDFIEKSSSSVLPTFEYLLTSHKDSFSQSAYSLFFWQIGRILFTKDMKETIKKLTLKYSINSSKTKLENISKAYFPQVKHPNFKSEDSITNEFVSDYPQVARDQDNVQQISPLLYAITRQNFDMCKFMIKHLGFDVNTCDASKVCALVYAIRTNNVNLCSLLMNADHESSNQADKKANSTNANQQVSKNNVRMKNLFNSLMPTKPNVPVKLATSSKKQNSDDDESDEFSEEDDNNNQEELNEFTNYERSSTSRVANNIADKTFKVKTDLVLNVSDDKSKTIFHHLACSLQYGSFQNNQIAKLLFNAFNSISNENSATNKFPTLSEFLKRVDSKIKTASDYALLNGNIQLYEEFKSILNKASYEILPNELNKFSVDDKFYKGATSRPDYLSDSQAFLKNHPTNNDANEKKKDYFEVDRLSNMDKIGCLVWDRKSNVPFDVILTKTDVSYGLYGMHNFYKMQLITYLYTTSESNGQSDENQMCVLFTRWGRIGDVGQYQRTPFSNVNEAKAEFCKIFKQKTGNDFMDTVVDKRKNFENKPRRYNLIKLESRMKPKLKDIDFDLFDSKSGLSSDQLLKNQKTVFEKSKFAQSPFSADFREFWVDLLDVNFLKKRIHNNSIISAEYIPLTQLTRESINKAYDILNKNLKPLIERRMELEKLSKKDHAIECLNLLDQINKYSNDFYELIPQMNYNYEKLKPISNERELDDQICNLNQLSNSQLACRILMGAKYCIENRSQNPFDYVYAATNCKFEPLLENDVETQYILRYALIDDQNKFMVKRIFKFERPTEQERFDKFSMPSGNNILKYKNRYLLWHGTSTENLLSIMHNGLRIAPNDARSNGHRFGKGIYLSDSFEFSHTYSRGRFISLKAGENDQATKKKISKNYMLLCEASLGKVKELQNSFETIDELPSGYDSIKSLGNSQPDPSNNVVLPNGAVIPLGQLISPESQSGNYFQTRNSNFDQYVVYNEAQVCIRYIIQYYAEN